MARPRKKGLDYLPLDVHFFDDRRMRKLNAKYSGGKASFIYLRLVTEIYQNGFYIELGEDDINFYAYESKIRKSQFVQILNDLADNGYFDRQLYDQYGILTSEDIQRQYFSIKNSNSTLELSETDAKYVLIDLSKYKNIKLPVVSPAENYTTATGKPAENDSKTFAMPTENHSKTDIEKKSKENKSQSKEKETATLSPQENDFQQIINLFPAALRPKTDADLRRWQESFQQLSKQIGTEKLKQIVRHGLQDRFWQTKLLSLPYLLHKSKTDNVAIWLKLNAELNGKSRTSAPLINNPQPVSTVVNVI